MQSECVSWVWNFSLLKVIILMELSAMFNAICVSNSNASAMYTLC
jgi:hypothetical protein